VNKSFLITRSIQILATLACALATLVTILGVSHLAIIYKQYFLRTQTGQPLPAITLFVLSLADRFSSSAGALSVAAAIVCLATAYFLVRSAPTAEARSFRLFSFVSVVWLACFVFLAVATLSFSLPFILRFP
jgi:type II secretory pathway component PulF